MSLNNTSATNLSSLIISDNPESEVTMVNGSPADLSLDIQSPYGFGVPAVTTTQRLALVVPNRTLVFDITLNQLFLYASNTWAAITAGGGTGIVTIDGDTGNITGSTVSIIGTNAGASVKFANSGSVSNLTFTNVSGSTYLGGSSGNTSGNSNNTGVGYNVMPMQNGASNNCGFGSSSLTALTVGVNNCGFGLGSLGKCNSGQSNLGFGSLAGFQYTTESHNIAIGHQGVAADSGFIRIGTGGTQTKCFIAGITGVAPSGGSTPQVTLCDSAGQLSTISSGTSGWVLTSQGSSIAIPIFQPLPASSITIAGDTGSISGSSLTIHCGNSAGASVEFINSGTTSVLRTTDPSGNTYIGTFSGEVSNPGTDNTAVGESSMIGVGSSSSKNCAFGNGSLGSVGNGVENCAFGAASLGSLNGGNNNTVIGYNAGSAYTGLESNNILISHVGVAATDSGVIRIGTSGSQTSCFVAGITGVSPAGANLPQVTLTDDAGQLTVIDSGTSGWVLTSNGADTPTFQSLPGGGVTSITASTGITCSPNPIVSTGTVAIANTAVTAGSYTAANITVNAQGQITAAANGFNAWVNETGTGLTMTVNTGYTIDEGSSECQLLLPPVSSVGDFVEINGEGSTGWAVTQGSGQQIFQSAVGATTAGTGGSISASTNFDCVRLRCLVANTAWTVVSYVGSGLHFI